MIGNTNLIRLTDNLLRKASSDIRKQFIFDEELRVAKIYIGNYEFKIERDTVLRDDSSTKVVNHKIFNVLKLKTEGIDFNNQYDVFADAGLVSKYRRTT